MALVGKRDINNVEVEIHANKHGGWSILLPEEGGVKGRQLGGHASSLDLAINAARLEIKRLQVKINVPFKTREGKRGIATGRHARSHDKILTEVEGKKEHFGYREQVFKADMPQSVVDHLNEIEDEYSKLQAEKRAIIEEWKLDLGVAVNEAINAAEEK